MKCCETKPSDLRYGVTLLSRQLVGTDGMGGRVMEWASGPSTRARIDFGALRDRETGLVLTAAGNATMYTRLHFPVESGQRIRIHEGPGMDAPVEYEVIGSDPVASRSRFRKTYLRLMEHEPV